MYVKSVEYKAEVKLKLTRIDDYELGGEILALRQTGSSLREIEDEIYRRYRIRISYASISTWLKSKKARECIPTNSADIKAKNIIRDFAINYNEYLSNLCDDCRDKSKQFLNKFIEEYEIPKQPRIPRKNY